MFISKMINICFFIFIICFWLSQSFTFCFLQSHQSAHSADDSDHLSDLFCHLSNLISTAHCHFHLFINWSISPSFSLNNTINNKYHSSTMSKIIIIIISLLPCCIDEISSICQCSNSSWWLMILTLTSQIFITLFWNFVEFVYWFFANFQVFIKIMEIIQIIASSSKSSNIIIFCVIIIIKRKELL